MPHSVRDLVRSLDRAALATALPTKNETWPYVSLVIVAVDHDLSPLLLMHNKLLLQQLMLLLKQPQPPPKPKL